MQEEKPWQFYPRDPKQSLDDFAEEGMEDALPPPLPPRRADEIRGEASDKTDAKLRRALYALRKKSRSSLEEKGVVTLFLALGSAGVDGSGRQQSENPISAFVSSGQPRPRSEAGDVQTPTLSRRARNSIPTLTHKISGDFGLTLPEPPELDAAEPGRLFRRRPRGRQKQGRLGRDRRSLPQPVFVPQNCYPQRPILETCGR